MPSIHLKKQILCALFTTLTAISSQISIPLPFTPVPINLATLAILLSAALLGVKYAVLSQLLYLLLGLCGLPVFAQFSSGAGILFGATGGYLIGYLLIALICGLLIEQKKKGRLRFLPIPLIFCIGIFFCYTAGTWWFMYSTHTPFLPALLSCVLPFLPGDALKIIAASILTQKLRQNFI